MADSTVSDFTNMKVTDLRKELKTRGLPHTGGKTELVARLQAAVNQDDSGDINLDSDEIDSDTVLEDEDEKVPSEITDTVSVNDSFIEELALADPTPLEHSKPHKAFKRKLITAPESIKNGDNSEPKKITLNRTAPTVLVSETSQSKSDVDKESIEENDKVEISPDIDADSKLEIRAKRFGVPATMSESEKKQARLIRFHQQTEKSNEEPPPNSTSTDSDQSKFSKLEMRAKRFGLPVKMSDTERKQARLLRFGKTTAAAGNTQETWSDNLEKLKKRSERFGQSVSNLMVNIENKEKLEKRKAKFAATD